MENKKKEASYKLNDLNPESMAHVRHLRSIMDAPQKQQEVEYIAEEITDRAALAFLKRLNEKIARLSCFK